MTRLFIKGFLIGIGKIIPGISGSLIACFLNVYDESIMRIKSIYKNPKENIAFFLPLSIGFLISLIIGSKALQYLFTKYYTVSILLISLVLIISLPTITRKKDNKSIIISILTLIISNTIFKTNSKGIFIYENDLKSKLTVLMIGIIESFSTVFPGVSGTAIYMNLGYYNFILDLFSNIYKYLLTERFILFILAVSISFYLLVLLLNFLIKKYHDNLYSVILGFAYFSIYQLLNNINNILAIVVLLLSIIYTNKKRIKT